MGLTIFHEMNLPSSIAMPEVIARLGDLQHCASKRFEDVSEVIQFEAEERAIDRVREGTLDGLEAFVHLGGAFVIDAIVREQGAEMPWLKAPAAGFAIWPGKECECASFGLLQVPIATKTLDDRDLQPGDWWWYCHTKTQYASIVSDEHFVRCHTGVVSILDDAIRLGFDVRVSDETDYWTHRDEQLLLRSVHDMNRLIAHFAGQLHDQLRGPDGTSHIESPIFSHPDWERLETEGEGDR